MKDRSRVYVIVGIIAVIGVLASLLVGAVAGGIAGYFVGRQQAQAVVRDELELGGQQTVPQLRMPQPNETTPYVNPQVQPLSLGALLTSVTADSPAAKAGLEEGDVILAVNGEKLSVAMELTQVIRKYKPGDVVTIAYRRDGKESKVEVTLGKHPDDPERPYLGVSYRAVMTSPD
jgi:S1-C subfamily serine protease